MTREPQCPDCGQTTEWITEIDHFGIVTDMPTICDGCQADRSTVAAFEDVTMDNDVWGGATPK